MVQPLLPNQSVSNFSDQPTTWSDLARVCRRVCILRERGLAEEAEQLRTGQLAAMVTAVRTPQETDEAIERKLAGLFATETERVANAAALAELLAPMLTDARIAPLPLAAVSSAAPFAAASAAPFAVGTAPSTTPFPPASSTPPAAAPAAKPARVAGALDLAGFIDEMIAQERAS